MHLKPLAGWLFAPLVVVLSACGGAGAASNQPAAMNHGASPTPAPLVLTASATVGGKTETILTDDKGMTLYYYVPDKGGKITCTGQCLVNWPPLLLTSGSAVPHAGAIMGSFTTLANPEGKGNQVLYNSWPLYFWVKDQKPGDTTGEGVGGKWHVATPDLAAGA